MITSLRRDNSELETKVLKLEYENSQLKVSKVSRGSAGRRSAGERASGEKEEGRRAESQSSASEQQEPVMAEVEEAVEQVRREPIDNILKRKEQNFRALKTDPRQVNAGNKVLKELAGICKDYSKSLKKPVLVLRLQATDFE
jgi:hypothetical protein